MSSPLIFLLVAALFAGLTAVDGCHNNTQCEPHEYCDHQLYLCVDCSEACDPDYEGFAVRCHRVCHDWCSELVNETSGLNSAEARSQYPLCWDQPKVNGSTTTQHPTVSCRPDDEDCGPGDSGSGSEAPDDSQSKSLSGSTKTRDDGVKTTIPTPSYVVRPTDNTTPTTSASNSSSAWPVAYAVAGICGVLILVGIVQGLYIFKRRHRLRRSRQLIDDDDVEGDPEDRRMISIERRGPHSDSQL